MSKKMLLLFIGTVLLNMAGTYVHTAFLLVGIVLCLCLMWFSSVEENFYITLFLIPNIRILDPIGPSFLVNLLMAVPLVLYYFKNPKRKIYPIALIAVLVFAVYEYSHSMMLGYIDGLISTVSCFLGMYYCVTVSLDDDAKITTRESAVYIMAGVLSSALAYMMVHLEFTANIISEVVDGNRFHAYAGDPNYYSLYICVALAMFFTLNTYKLYDFVFMLLTVAVGLLTASKTCLVIMAFIMVVGLLLKLLTQRRQGKFVAAMVAIFGVACIAARNFIVSMVKNFIGRLGITSSGMSLDKITTGRFSIATYYFELLMQNYVVLLFGSGMSYNIFLGAEKNYEAHNTYLDVILSWGLIGVVMMIIFFVAWLNKYYRIHKRSKSLIVYMPIVVLMAWLMTLSCLSATSFWWVVTVVIMATSETEQHREVQNG